MASFWEKLVYRWCKQIKETSCEGAYPERCSQSGFFVDSAEIWCTSIKFFWTHSKAANNRKTISQLINTNEQTCICVCVFLRIFIRTYVYTYTHIRIYTYAHMRIHIRTYAYTYTHIRVYLYAHTRIHIRTYMYIYTRIMHVFWLTYIWAVLYTIEEA